MGRLHLKLLVASASKRILGGGGWESGSEEWPELPKEKSRASWLRRNMGRCPGGGKGYHSPSPTTRLGAPNKGMPQGQSPGVWPFGGLQENSEERQTVVF